MIQIRNNTFETNSSSTHAISIVKETESWVYNTPRELDYFTNKIVFDLKEYGWEWDDREEPASYIYTYIWHYLKKEGFEDAIQYIEDVCKEHNYNCAFTKKNREKYAEKHEDYTWYEDDSYIDHGDELSTFWRKLRKDRSLFWRYLCNGTIYTGNDNSSIRLPKKSKSYNWYYKGN